MSSFLYVEDILPQWRLHTIQKKLKNSKKLINLYKDIGKNRVEIRNALWQDIAKYANIPSPKNALEAAFTNMFQGPNSNGDMELYGIKTEEHPAVMIDNYW